MQILNIKCCICTDLFNNADDVYSTSCGHIFHFSCMNEWKRRGTSCPQCHGYNPTTHKLYLNFDGSDDDLEKQVEIELKLQNSNAEITQLLVQINESETNFLQLQKQYTGIEKSKRALEERRGQINDSETNFLHLQEQYMESSEHVRSLQDRIKQLHIESECKSKELQLKRLENESLKASWEAEQNSLSGGILHEKVKVLEQKLKLISEEFEKEIETSTQLSIDKMKLQSYVNHLKSLEKITDPSPKQTDKKPNFRRDCENFKKCNEPQKPLQKSSNQTDDGSCNSVFIKGLPLNQISIPLENVIVHLALKMNLSISEDDLIKVSFVDGSERKSSRPKLLAQFKSNKLKDDFLSKKFVLKNNPTTKYVIIHECMSEELFALFKYAKEKLIDKGYESIFFTNNKVFAKKYRSQRDAVHIESKTQVDIMIKFDEKVMAPGKLSNTIDENFYQL